MYDDVISVAAIDPANNLTHASFSLQNNKVDIAAPGVGIESTYKYQKDDYAQRDGTSFAAPFVTGIAALLWSHCPEDCTAAEIKSILLDTAKPAPDTPSTCRINSECYKNKCGRGVVNALAAYQRLKENNFLRNHNHP